MPQSKTESHSAEAPSRAPTGFAWDAVIIGAGPAGLTAATYLARYRRRVLVLDGGPSRAEYIPESHNTPGFPRGIGGTALLGRLREQAQDFGAVIQHAWVEGLDVMDGGFRATGVLGTWTARAVLLATGVVDRMPPDLNLEAAIRDGRVRVCPICDAFEATGRRLAVLGDGALAYREAEFLRTYSDDVQVLLLDVVPNLAREGAQTIAAMDLEFGGASVRLHRGAGRPLEFDHLYLALGCAPQSHLAVYAGARDDDQGKIVVDAHQMTSVEGLFAAGDVVRGLNQIAVGGGEAAIAATAIHNRLRGPA